MMSRRYFQAVCLLLLLTSFCAWTFAQSAQTVVDPNKASSEFNHHVAGYALIGVGLLVLAGLVSPRLRSLRFLWPFLFILAGLFLAAWSDAEIWPRGNLSWTWLLHHDTEARQHKIYAILLLAMGLVEYLRARGSLGRFWRVWSFPILAVIGAGLLLVHDHTGSSGARSPEAAAYLVNPALDPDGKPRPANPPDDPPANAPAAMDSMHHDMDMDHSAMALESAPMDHSHMNMDASTAQTNPAAPSQHGHSHHMTPSMLLVEREHFWFMIVGLAVALFKFISDAGFFQRRFVAYLWPSTMIVLGIMLTLYHE